MAYGCVFCRTGRESSVGEALERKIPGLRALIPYKLRLFRSRGTVTEQKVTIFPGYCFISAPEDADLYSVRHMEHVYRLLTDGEGCWQLRGADRTIAEKLFSVNGVIGLSKAYYVGDRLRVTEGFLKDYQGSIIRVNRRAGTAQIRIEFDGKMITAWVGFEMLDGPVQ